MNVIRQNGFGSLIVIAFGVRTMTDTPYDLYRMIFGTKTIDTVMTWNPERVGVYGGLFCFIWIIRERVLMFVEKMMLKYKNSIKC